MNLDDLNAEQRRAVLHDEGPLLVLAGAGSGKTRVITYRIARLIERGTPPSALFAVTFTNKAAGEMRQRAEKLVGAAGGGAWWIGTFHGICARLLRIYGESIGLSRNFQIYDTTDQRALATQVLRELGVSERLFAPADILGRIDRAKNAGIGPGQFEGGDFFSDVVAKVYPRYEKRLLAANAVDFGNLLLKTLELLRADESLVELLSRRFAYLLVDEFQDTNHVQYELVRLLSSRHRNLCVVGDDDQSIYSWRGADIRNILDFEQDHPDASVVKLEQNYRSTQTILDAAGAVIERNRGRKPKKLWTEAGAGDQIVSAPCLDERDEATFVVQEIERLRRAGGHLYGDFALFYRTHAQSRVLEEALRAARPSIPHVVVGGTRFYDRAEVKDLLGYLRLVNNPADDIALLRVINMPPRGIGANTVEKVSAYARERGIGLLDAALESTSATGSGGARLGTKTRASLRAFCDLILELRDLSQQASVVELAEAALERSGYAERLATDPSPGGESRAENLMELIGSIRDYQDRAPEPKLDEYLEQVALASDVDAYVEDEGAVTLMTVHGAKGLEFSFVFIVGLEQGIFPHARALSDPDQMEEERRLAYVAMTRARRRLYLARAERRWVFGQHQVNPPSQFISDVPQHLICIPPQLEPRQTERHAQEAYPSRRRSDEVWVDFGFDQSEPSQEETDGFCIGMKVRHQKFGIGSIRLMTGSPPNLNLTIQFKRLGARTIRSQFVERV